MKWMLDKILETGTGFLPGWYFDCCPGEPSLLSLWANEPTPSTQTSTEFSERDWQTLQLLHCTWLNGWEGIGMGFLSSKRISAWCYPSWGLLKCLGCVKDRKASWHHQSGFEGKWNLMLELSGVFEAASSRGRHLHLSTSFILDSQAIFVQWYQSAFLWPRADFTYP